MPILKFLVKWLWTLGVVLLGLELVIALIGILDLIERHGRGK